MDIWKRCQCNRHDRFRYAGRYHRKQWYCAGRLYQPASSGRSGEKEAIARAGVTRLRPILMTAITTVLGLVPMVVGGSMGTDMTRPMAIVTIGGLIYGTILTLFVVPCIYDLVNRKEMKKIDVK